MKVVLHICCAPCAIEVIRELREKIGNDIQGFFYNPNIHPLSEYLKRKECLEYYINNFAQLPLVCPEYQPQEYFLNVDFQKEYPARCIDCWKLRLDKTAKYAKENGFSAFTSTLLVSPYQSQEKLKQIGENLAKKYNVEFLFMNFRKFYAQGRKKAKELNLYRQNYCGCLFSELERYKKIKNRTSGD